MADGTLGPPVLPSFKLPPQILPAVPDLPRPNLDLPTADLPSYKPMLVPAGALRGPTGKETDEEDDEPAPAEVQRVNVPFTDITVPIPQEKQCVKVFKPIIMQLAKRIQKKFKKNGDTDGQAEESSGQA